MKKIAKILIISLIMTMCLSVIGVTSYAQSGTADLPYQVTKSGWIAIETGENQYAVFNPVYMSMEEMQKEAQARKAPLTKKSLKKANSASASEEDALPLEEALKEYRKGLARRDETVTVNVLLEGRDVNDIVQDIWDDVFLHTGISNEGDYLNYNMDLFSISVSEYPTFATLTLCDIDYYTTAEQEDEVTSEIGKVMESFHFSDAMTPYEKTRTIYNYICKNIEYDNDKTDSSILKHTTFAAIIKKKAVCQGYATLFYRMALEAGLDARVVVGMAHQSSNDENHAWNIVEIDGKYYELDSTWDTNYRKSHQLYQYFLKGTEDDTFNSEHEAGIAADENGDIVTVPVPEECDRISEDNYRIPFEILEEPQDNNLLVGDSILWYVDVMGEDVSFDWRIELVGPYSADNITRQYANFGPADEENREIFDGATAYCVITDNTTGETYTTRKATIRIFDDSDVEMSAHSLSLNGDIAVNFYMTLTPEVVGNEHAYMLFTIPSITPYTVKIPAAAATVTERELNDEVVTLYRFTAGVPAKDMTQDIHAEFYLDDDTKMVDEKYCVREYADAIRNDTEGNFKEGTSELVTAMLNYGGYAQTYFNYHTEDLANSGLDISLPESVSLGEEYARIKEGSTENAEYIGSRLILRTNTILRIYFQINGDISQYRFFLDGNEVDAAENKEGTNYYTVELSGIAANQLGDAHTITVQKSGSGESLTIITSAYSNAKSFLDHPENNPVSLINVLKALYVYGEQARTYFAA